MIAAFFLQKNGRDAKANNLESVKTWLIENKLTLSQAETVDIEFRPNKPK